MKKLRYYLSVTICFLIVQGGPTHAQWKLQTTLADKPPLLSVKAVSKDIAWTCSGSGTVYRTTDGGKTWKPTSAISNEALGCIEVLDANTAIVGGEGPGYSGGDVKIYRTMDGGQSWQVVYTATGQKTAWGTIQFFDSQNGIAMSDPASDGGNFVMVKTADGGKTWTPIANPPVANAGEFGTLNCLHFYDKLNGWFGTGAFDPNVVAGRIFRTTDGGNTWEGFPSGNNLVVVGVRFISPMVGIRTSVVAPMVTRSADGGKTWTEVNNLPVTNISRMYGATSVNTPNSNQVWLPGDGNPPAKQFILSSVDGGLTWHQQPIVDAIAYGIFHVSAVSFGDSVQAWGITIDQNTFASGGEILSYRQRLGFVTGVQERANIPAEYALSQNFPNPFNPSTTIHYSLAQAGHVSLKIFNLAGQEIATLVGGKQNSGEHHVQWQAVGVPSGVYFYQLQAGEKVETRKMILLR